jgi:probable rRNA maturation factor
MPTAVLRRAAGSPALAPSRVARLADRLLGALDLEAAELSVLLTNDAQIHELNRVHRDKDRPTDVLAFPLEKPAARGASRYPKGRGLPQMLGDVVISLDTAARQARGRKRELFAEVRFLLVHGVLHLLGYDHGTRREKRQMDAMARRLVRVLVSDGKTPSPAPSRGLKRPRKPARAGHSK